MDRTPNLATLEIGQIFTSIHVIDGDRSYSRFNVCTDIPLAERRTVDFRDRADEILADVAGARRVSDWQREGGHDGPLSVWTAAIEPIHQPSRRTT